MRPNTEPPKITIILLNYKRPQNIPVILRAIRNQTVKSIVFLWNNGDDDVNSPLIDRYERSGRNVGCMVRWKLAREATTPYIMSIDDDICFHRDDALENIILSLENQDNPNRIIGPTGVCFGPIATYKIRKEFSCLFGNGNSQTLKDININKLKHVTYVENCSPDHAEAVDIIKGRSMAFRKDLLDGVILPEEREDDIFLSATLANKARKFHRVPAILNYAFYELPEHSIGNWHQPGHFSSRDRALISYVSRNTIIDNRITQYILIRAYSFKKFVSRIFNRSKFFIKQIFFGLRSPDDET